MCLLFSALGDQVERCDAVIAIQAESYKENLAQRQHTNASRHLPSFALLSTSARTHCCTQHTTACAPCRAVQHSNAAYAEVCAERDRYSHQWNLVREEKTQLEQQLEQVSGLRQHVPRQWVSDML